MRLSFVLLAAVVTLLASSGTASASGQSKQSTIASLDAAPAKNGRFLRGIKAREEGEERGLTLQKIDDLLASLNVAEANMLSKLGKFDSEILQKIDNISGAEARINRWKEAEWDPTYVANMSKNDYPTLSLHGAEWKTWKLYAAQYLRQYHSLNPLCEELYLPSLERFHVFPLCLANCY